MLQLATTATVSNLTPAAGGTQSLSTGSFAIRAGQVRLQQPRADRKSPAPSLERWRPDSALPPPRLALARLAARQTAPRRPLRALRRAVDERAPALPLATVASRPGRCCAAASSSL